MRGDAQRGGGLGGKGLFRLEYMRQFLVTLADVASSGLAAQQVVQAAQQAIAKGMVSKTTLRACVQRRGGRSQHSINHSLVQLAVQAPLPTLGDHAEPSPKQPPNLYRHTRVS
jgi:hypothetical protein